MVAVHPQDTESTAPLRAAALARECGATLHLRMVIWQPDLARDLFHLGEDRNAHRQELEARGAERLAELSGSLNATVGSAEVHWGHPFDAPMLELVEALRPDLVVMATCRDEHPSTAEWRLIRGCRTPLLLCHHNEWHFPPRILACVDPGHAHDKTDDMDRNIVAVAERLEASLHQPYELLHAAGMTPILTGDQPYTDQYRAREDGQREAAIRALLPEDKAADAPIHFSHSTPVEAILAFVHERQFDICVLGLVNRSRWRELLIGSTPRDLIPRMNCDLLLMPHPAAGWVPGQR